MVKSTRLNIRGKSFNVSESRILEEYYDEVSKGKWKPEIYEVLDAFLDEEQSYIDLGAWIGTTVFYGCQLAKHCYTMEPDPEAYKQLQDNLALNIRYEDKISLSKECLYSKSGEVTLGNDSSPLGGNGYSSLFYKNPLITWDVPSLTFEDFIKKNEITEYNFINMDIQGGEAHVLPQMADLLKKTKPTLLLSMYPSLYGDQVEELVKEIIRVISDYKHIITYEGMEILPEFLLNDYVGEAEYNLVVTDVPMEKIKHTTWGLKVDALSPEVAEQRHEIPEKNELLEKWRENKKSSGTSHPDIKG